MDSIDTGEPRRGRGRPRIYETDEARREHERERKRRARAEARARREWGNPSGHGTGVVEPPAPTPAPDHADDLLVPAPSLEAQALAQQQIDKHRTRHRARVIPERIAALPVTLGGGETSSTPQQRLDPDLQDAARTYPNVASMLQYVRDVLDGREPACKWVRLACERHERDAERIGTKGWPFRFNPDAAERVMRAVQMFREIKGPRAGKRMVLGPWQRFVLGSVFGWVRVDNGARRFHYLMLFVPRGNGKTTLAAPLGLYMLSLDGEGGAECYAAAVTRQQARLVFDCAQFMAQRDPAYVSRFGIDVGAKAITQTSSASTFRPLSRDATTLDGLNVHFAVLDEIAQHKTREVYDVLVTGAGKRKHPLIAGISTAGSNTAGVGYEQWKYTERVLSGEITDEMFFGIIYTIDEGDDWTDPLAWRKANPNWGVSVMPEVIANLCRRAQSVASQQAAFKQKHLNIWTAASSPWMEMDKWRAAGDPALKMADFRGEETVLGLDLAAKIDLAAKVNLFRRDIDGVLHYYAFAQCYLPEATIESGVNAQYETWRDGGWITATPGEVNDLTIIQEDVIEDAAAFKILDTAYDPWQGHQLAGNLDREDIPVIEVRPTVQNFSEPMKEIDALVRSGRFHHDGNPVLDYCVSCVEVWRDNKDNIYPRKDKDNPQKKIDALIALLMAMARWMALDADEEAGPSIMTLN